MPGFIKRSSLWEWNDKRRAENILRGLKNNKPMPDAAELNQKLIKAVKASMPETVQALVKAGAGPDAQLYYTHGGTHSYPVITLAVGRDDIRMVEVLVSCGADLEKQDSHSGHTALIEAVRRGKTAMVRKLLDLGASLDTCTSIHSEENIDYIRPTKPLEIAQRHGFAGIEKMLKDEPARRVKARAEAEAAKLAVAKEAQQQADAAAQAIANMDPSVTQTGQGIKVMEPLQIKRKRGLFS